MANEKLIKNVVKVYTEVMRRLVDKDYKISQGGENIRIITNLLDSLGKEYGDITTERLVDFCIFSAHFYHDKKVMLKQAFGPTALKRFKESKSGRAYYENKWLEREGITRQSLYRLIADRKDHPHAKYIYMVSEESLKYKLLNEKAGYILCQNSTLGWSPLSASCKQCIFTSECMKETQRKYPELYRIRLENGEKEQ
nr:MAG TPA: hypothetical protein [Caudoviricetes sp.]